MDTIIFFYKKSDLEKPLMTVRESGNYRFLKIGLNITAEQWFRMPIPKLLQEAEEDGIRPVPEKERCDGEVTPPAEACIGSQAAKQPIGKRKAGRGFGLRSFFGMGRREKTGQKDSSGKCRGENSVREACSRKKHRGKDSRKISFGKNQIERERVRIEELERMHRRQQYETAVELLEGAMGSIVRTALKGVGELDFCACVYGSGVRKLLLGETPLAVHWNKAWTVPEFADYREYRWGVELLPYVTCSRLVVLGVVPDIPLILKSCARKMKSLRWILPERDYGEAVQAFIEDFYEDYGLAISVQTVTGRNAFRTLCLESVEPVCILDFTDETKFFFGGLEPGSVWLDFLSVEEKAKRLERLAKNVSYYSLKRLWTNENPTKTYFLDSTDKSGYNTEVNRLTICDDKGF